MLFLKETAKIGKICFKIEACYKISEFARPFLRKLREKYILFPPNLYFSYLCTHQPKKNIPTQKITDYITY